MSDAEALQELEALVHGARAWLEAIHDSGVEELAVTVPALPSPTAVAARGSSESYGRPSRPRPPAAPRGGPQPGAPPPPWERAPSAKPSQPGSARPDRPPFSPPQGPERPRPATANQPASAPRREPLGSEERRRRLALIEEEVASCRKCPLHETRTKTAFARGNPDAELVFIGEGPGTQEDLQGLPFVGPAGQLLDKMIAAMGYGPDDVYILNIVKCRPPDKANPRKDRKPEPHEMAACMPYLERQMELLDPKAIVALGATAAQGLTGLTVGITRLRGNWKLFKGRIPLMPTFHPAYLLRSPDKKREVWSDLKQVMDRLGKKPPTPRKR